MTNFLDNIFGKERVFLGTNSAEIISGKITEAQQQNSKNKNFMLSEYAKHFSITKNSKVMLIDDNAKYQKPAEDAGYGFIHAPRKEDATPVDDNAYLFDVLLQTIDLNKINEGIDKSSLKIELKQEVKTQFNTYCETNGYEKYVFNKLNIELYRNERADDDILVCLSKGKYKRHHERQIEIIRKLKKLTNKDEMKNFIDEQLKLAVRDKAQLSWSEVFSFFNFEKQWLVKSKSDPVYFILKALQTGLTCDEADTFYDNLKKRLNDITLPQKVKFMNISP